MYFSQVYFGRTHLSFRKQALASKKKMAMSTAMAPDVDKMAAGSTIPNKSCLNNACRFRNGMRKYDKSNWFGLAEDEKHREHRQKDNERHITLRFFYRAGHDADEKLHRRYQQCREHND